MQETKRYQFLGFPLDALTMQETLDWVQKTVQNRTPRQHTVLNAAKVVNARKDAFLRESIDRSDLINVDGQAVVWGARLLGLPVPERVTGIDLMANILQTAHLKKFRVFFFGATSEVLDALLKTVASRYPALVIAGSRNGYFEVSEELKIAREIRASKADILFVAMPTPKKEKFIQKYLQEMNVPFAMGVGGSFDVLAGKVSRAPVWMQKAGLEWLHRLSQEPRRLLMRYLNTNFVFLGLVGRELLRRPFRPDRLRKGEPS